jgi:1-phosphofructokinase family hexose kinase
VILCVCLSPALDVTYRVPALTPGATNRVRAVTHRPGGKAVNVARILHALGADVRLLAPAGGDTGGQFADDLARLGLTAELIPNAQPTRRTVAVVDDQAGDATVFVEPAEIDCWPVLVERATVDIPAAAVVVVSGSVPSGAPADALSTLIGIAHRAGRPVLIDTSGPPLVDALSARPTLIKPNAEELSAVGDGADPVSAAVTIAATYDTTVIASLGADGLVAATEGRAWRARPARPLAGNPTGAGDALVAGLARGIVHGRTLPEQLTDGIALSAAAVLSPLAGDIDPAHYAEQLAGATVHEVVPGGVR